MTRHALLLGIVLVFDAGAQRAGSKACAVCHADIVRRYSQTAMARTSGAVPESGEGGSFTDNRSGYAYSVTGNRLVMKKAGSPQPPQQRTLRYFAGSGKAARSFLLDVDGFLYEAPVTYYAASHAWNLSPGYGRYTYPFLTRAIAPGCLNCHASQVRPLAGTQNGYEAPPFLENGVACERCHGAGSTHVRTTRAADIVNPARLAFEQRNSICEQCHLSGEIRVDKAGRNPLNFAPGEKLSDYTTAFVRATSSPRMKVTSHAENLAQSRCSRESGQRLWCGSCHDPHSEPAPAERVAWFRSKCLSCHTVQTCRASAAARAAKGDDCTVCHMPRSAVADAEHVVYTDHSIPRHAEPRDARPPLDAELIAFGNQPASSREQGLAYAIVAIRENNSNHRERAFRLLRAAERQNPDDPQTLSYLADIYRSKLDDASAAQLYERLLRVDPAQSSAPAALGAYAMERGRYADAIRLWKQALAISPALVLVRMNLAEALLQTGERDEARSMLEKTLYFNPAFDAARKRLTELRARQAAAPSARDIQR